MEKSEKRKYSVVENSEGNYDIQLKIFTNGSKESTYRFTDLNDATMAQKIFEDTLIGEGYEKDEEHADGHHFIKRT